MMGTKARVFGFLPPGTLEDLVPPDHFYRHLERMLDLRFVRDLVRAAYADSGRPSIDPVVFFKLQLILFFEGLRSELRPLADENGQIGGYVCVDPPLNGFVSSVTFRQDADHRPEIVATVPSDDPTGEAETYVFTLLEPPVAATPAP
jgi:hypothetical protein